MLLSASLVSVRRKNVQEMLAQKELDLARVQRELQALRIVASLLQDEENWVKETADPTRNVTVVQRSAAQGEAVIPKSRGWRKLVPRASVALFGVLLVLILLCRQFLR
jgi:hypothetical protein